MESEFYSKWPISKPGLITIPGVLSCGVSSGDALESVLHKRHMSICRPCAVSHS